MNLTFLGTGTSHGVPAIGCDCEVCRSPDPRNKRMRSSVYVRSGEAAVLVDCTPEFRLQAIAHGVRRVDGVVLTHAHADHIMGIDDLRRINELQNGPVTLHGSPDSLNVVRRTFAYAFEPGLPGPTCPALNLSPMEGPLTFGHLKVTPLPCDHGLFKIHGFLFEEKGSDRAIAYFPDCNGLPDVTLDRLRGIEVMILDGLRPHRHPTHFSLPETLEKFRIIGARRSYITHLCHLLEHRATQAAMPPGVFVPWDGLTIEA